MVSKNEGVTEAATPYEIGKALLGDRPRLGSPGDVTRL
jgi:hypothetical protein